MMKPPKLSSLLLAGAVSLTACTDVPTESLQPGSGGPAFSAAPVASGTFLVIGRNGRLPRDLAARVDAAGATLEDVTPQIGIALVRSADPDFARNFSGTAGVEAVVPDLQYHVAVPRSVAVEPDAHFQNPPNSGDDDFFFDAQWGHDAVDAVEAWNAGYRGRGARVVILDSGINSAHPDLAPNLNTALSRSFVPGEDFNRPAGSHGTHVAGTIAAADNGFGVIGVAPEAEIVMLKVLSAITGSGSSYSTMAALVYAGEIEADVVNMSLGIRVPVGRSSFWYTDNGGTPDDPSDDQRVHVTGAEIQQFIQAYQRAVDYARSRGATVIASAGNESLNLQFTGSAVKLPAELRGVLSISATGPMGWLLDPSGSLDVLSSFSNYGRSGIDFAAPGGNFDFPGEDVCRLRFVRNGVPGVLTFPCWVFDGVLSTTPTGWGWGWGTSMAAPHASGVAALIVGKNGGSMAPAAVERVLRQSADDLGMPGEDDAYGSGRVNAFRAVTR